MTTTTARRARHPRFHADGLAFEVFATDDPELAYVVTEPSTAPVGYLFRHVGYGEMACLDIEEGLTRADLARLELLSPGRAPTYGTVLGDAVTAMLLGVANAMALEERSGRPVREAYEIEATAVPKPMARRGGGAKSIRY